MPVRFLVALVMAGSLLLAGCGPESKNPLSTPANSTVDERLEGLYVARREKRDDDLSALHVHYRRAKAAHGEKPRLTPWLEMLSIGHEGNDGLNQTAYRALTTHLGTHDYMSFVFPPVSAGKTSASTIYLFARYEVSPFGDLRIWMINMQPLEEAIKAGKIRGKIKHQNWVDDVLLTDSTEHLAAFVAASDPDVLFGGKPLIFHRVAR